MAMAVLIFIRNTDVLRSLSAVVRQFGGRHRDFGREGRLIGVQDGVVKRVTASNEPDTLIALVIISECSTHVFL